MKITYEKHLIWLQILELGTDEILRFYDNATLPPPNDEVISYYSGVANTYLLSPATRKRVCKKIYDRMDEAFFQRIGFHEIYLRDVAPERLDASTRMAWKQIDDLLQNPVVRIAVECLIISKQPAEEIAQLLSASAYQYNISVEAIELYERYFFKTGSFIKEDWRALLELVGNDSFTYSRYFTALTKPKADIIYLLELPTKRTFSDFLSNVLFTADYKFRYYARQNTEDGDSQARSWAKVGLDAGQKHEKYSSQDVTDFAEAVQTGFEYAETDIPMAEADLISQVKPDLSVGVQESPAPAPTKGATVEPEPY